MPRTARAQTPAQTPAKPAEKPARARVRMYRHGLGDCFLIRLPHAGSPDGWFSIMIDCGLLLGTPDAKAKMVAVVEDVAKTTGGRLDLLAVTHEHWDHVSGFVQAKDTFAAKFTQIDRVWAAWTENESDEQVRALKAGRQRAVAALQASALRLGALGAADAAEEVANLLGFFGIDGGTGGGAGGLLGAAGGTTPDAMRNALKLGKEVRYCEQTDAPFQPDGADWRIYVLGPPRDQALLTKSDPSRKAPETYPLAAAAEGLATVLDGDGDSVNPFNRVWAIPEEHAKGMDFFQKHYFNEDEDWRRIDRDWLGSPSELALKLDSDTNNTSLVLAIELPPVADGDQPEVLLFAADAQVGNWLSWQTLSWDVDGRRVTGPDLLSRTTLYKVGHHGSHNATLREKGLGLMKGLTVAMIPVDEEIAKKKRWNQMPRASILEALDSMVGPMALRSDRDGPDDPKLSKTDLYYEVAL